MRFPRTEKIEELLLAWMHPGLEHSGFSQRFRFLFLKQNHDFKEPQEKKENKTTCWTWRLPGSTMIEIIK